MASSDYDKGYETGHRAGHEAGRSYEKARQTENNETFTVTMSSDLFTAYRTDEPGIFEKSSVSAHDALGKLVARLYTVRTLGRLAS